jgi:hypothetical protein
MLRRWWLSGVAVGLFASVLLAKPGIVHTRDGGSFRGDVTEDGQYVTITTHGIATKVNKLNVAKIEYPPSVDEQYAERHQKLAADDVKGRIDLANWASQNQRPDLAVQALQEAQKIDPANRNVALLEDTAQRQWDLDQRQGKPGATAPPAGGPAPASQPAPAAATPPGKKKAPEYRLLNDGEVNIIREKEMQPNDPRLQVRLENNVARRYLAGGAHDAAAFRQMPPQQQAQEILASGDPKLTQDVRIVTDPAPLLEFRQKIHPLVASSCGSIACHGGGTHGGDFGLFTADTTNAVYTNFYILEKYTKTIDGVEYKMLNRTFADRSLLLEYGLPPGQADVAHPSVPGYRPRFRSRTDPAYTEVVQWLTQSLKPIPPDYGIDVSAKVPASQPAGKGK